MRTPVLLVLLMFLTFPQNTAQKQVLPDDPFFRYQYSFLNPGGTLKMPVYSNRPSDREYASVQGVDLNVTRAWALTTGSKKVVVALLDDGFFYQHEDVRSNIWRNPGESGLDERGYPKETNRIDDDKNGFVDDVVGWDFAFNDPDPDTYAFDGMDRTRVQPTIIPSRRWASLELGETTGWVWRVSIGKSP